MQLFKALIDKNLLDMLFTKFLTEMGQLSPENLLEIHSIDVTDDGAMIEGEIETIKLDS